MSENKYSTISIPKKLHEKIKVSIEDTGFKSVSDYVTFVLREILMTMEKDKKTSLKDVEEVRERLRILGYID
jgi:Arc/MetJ-type ribon-helix-helix transcriptional regulator